MEIKRFVTEWGFPAMRWQDRVSNMKGHPGNIRPRIDSKWVTRRMWINCDGRQVLVADDGEPIVIGPWDEWTGLSVGTTRDDLTPEQMRVIGMNRLAWVEHQTLSANFRDGRRQRIAWSAISQDEMRHLHWSIEQAFLVDRANYVPPMEGQCWVGGFSPMHVALEKGETSPTRIDVTEAECRNILVKTRFPVPEIHWKEPVRTRGRLGFGVRHHLVERMLFVGRGFGGGPRNLSFHSYKPGTQGVVEVHANFALLKGFRIADSRETYAAALQPLKGTLPGLSVVADFRYGLTLPLTCASVTSANPRENLEALKGLLEEGFLPLVGQALTDEQLGVAGRQ